MKRHVRLMIDSGAYTAWRQGATIDLARYIEFCSTNFHLIHSIVNLDVIPAKRTPAAVEEAAAQGWKNLRRMAAAGLKPIAVFHMGERRYWLEKMLGEGHKYIGLGGVANAGDKARRPWLDDMFEFLCGKCPYPSVKVHGFGITSVKMMLRYPWYSVDSVSWMKQGVIGSCYIPQCDLYGGLGFDYHRPPYALAFSKAGRKGASKLALTPGAHVDSVGPQFRQWVSKYLKQEGLTIKEVAGEYKQRVRLNSRFFRRFAQAYQHAPFSIRRDRLFFPGSVGTMGSTEAPRRFRLIFSVGTYLEYANILRQEKVRDQLVSFHRIENGPKFDLEKFVRTGWFCRATRPDEVII